jgi:phage N-6-adenine-methyltransferase
MSMLAQKPGKSKQDWQTPPELLTAIKDRLDIDEFVVDLAASDTNAVAPIYYTKDNSALDRGVYWCFDGYAWCNPPYANIEPWVRKAAEATEEYPTNIVMLVPSSVGSNWWKEWVRPYAYVTHLNGRIKFVGATDYYPKDCSILLYTPWGFKGEEIWSWQEK